MPWVEWKVCVFSRSLGTFFQSRSSVAARFSQYTGFIDLMYGVAQRFRISPTIAIGLTGSSIYLAGGTRSHAGTRTDSVFHFQHRR